MTWECPECGFDNEDDRDMCADCGAFRPAGTAPGAPVPLSALYADSIPAPAAAATAPVSAPLGQPPAPVVTEAFQPVSAPVSTPISQSAPSVSVPVSVPQSVSSVSAAPALTLSDPVMGEQLRLTDTTMLGRNAFSSMASNFAISRQHASVHFEQGSWTVTDEGSNNGTSIMRDGQILNLVPGVAQSIHTGDMLLIPAIAGGYAQLRLTVTVEEAPAVQSAQSQTVAASRPSVQPQTAPAPGATVPTADSSAGVEGWFVECPECGRLHLVAGERSKGVDGCDECGCSLARISAVYRTLEPGEDYTDVC